MTTTSAPLATEGVPVDTADLRIHDLGTLVVEVGGAETPFGGTKPGLVLAVLLVNANRRVSVDALVDAVWGEVHAESVLATLESHIWRLRKTTEPHRGRRQQPVYLVNDAGGYRLIVNPDNVDSLRFAQLAEQGDRLLATGEPDRSLDRYELALRLWRGRPFEAVADQEWAAPAIARLDELYGQVQEQRVEALLRLAAPDRAVASLEELVVRMPYRERLWGQLMTGLYQAGRVADALSAYQRARTNMLDALGLEPGDQLRDLQRRILDQDATLMPPARPPTAQTPATRATDAEPVEPPSDGLLSSAVAEGSVAESTEIHLPVRLSELIGREAEVTRLGGLLDDNRLVTLVGAAGCGKTRLSIELARAAARLAPDGIWFVDFTAVDDPTAVPGLVAATIGLEQPVLGTIVSALRSYSADRRILLVLDNCEHVLPGVCRVVEALLDTGSQARVLATSREPIGLDGEVLWTLPPLPTRDAVTDEVLATSPAARLFIARARQVDPTFSPTENLEQVESICRTVDGIPLAIELAAGRLRTASLDEIRRQVLTELGGLTRPGHPLTERHRTVESAIEWSARWLTDDDRAVHAALSELPGVFTAEAARAVGAEPGSAGGGSLVLGALDRLVHCSLLTVVPSQRAGQPTRFRQLATVRAHAARLLREAAAGPAARDRRTAFVADLVTSQPWPGAADDNGWHARIDDNHDTVAAVLTDQLIERPTAAGVRLLAQLFTYWFYRGRMIDGLRWLDAALRIDDASPADRRLVELTLAYVHALRDRTDLSLPLVRAALGSPTGGAADVPPDAAQLGSRTYAYGLVSAAWCVWVRQDPALDFVAGEVRDIAAGDPIVELWADLLDAKNALATDGPYVTAERAVRLIERGNALDAVSAVWLGGWLDVLCRLLLQDPVAGRARLHQVEACYRALGGTATANSVEFDANFAALAGDPLDAVRLFGTASRLAFRSGMRWPISPATEPVLAAVRRSLPAERFDQEWQAGDRAAASSRDRESG